MKLNDIQKWRAEALAWFGFSHRYIAATVLERRNVTDRDVARVAGYLCRSGVLVTAYRRGQGKVALANTSLALRPKKRKVRSA